MKESVCLIMVDHDFLIRLKTCKHVHSGHAGPKMMAEVSAHYGFQRIRSCVVAKSLVERCIGLMRHTHLAV